MSIGKRVAGYLRAVGYVVKLFQLGCIKGETAEYYVTKYTTCPAVLVETAFIDNPNDAKLLVEREDDFVRAIGDIGKYFSISEFVCHCR